MKDLLKNLRKSFNDVFDTFDKQLESMDDLSKRLDQAEAETITEHETRPDGTRITRTITKRVVVTTKKP